MHISFLIFVTLMVFSVCESKVFTRCKLAAELLKYKGINKTFLGNWVCLIEKVSKRNTRAFVVTPSGKKFYGLYQIPSRWCRSGKKGGECNVACESLLDDDIADDTACAARIFQKEGFKYWDQWTLRCKNNIGAITKDIYKCPELNSRRSNSERDLYSERLRRRQRLMQNKLEYIRQVYGVHV